MSARTSLVRTILGRLVAAALLGLILVATLVGMGVIAVPDRLNPFARLRVADEPNWLTRFKLGRLESDGPQCSSVLKSSRVAHAPIPDRVTGEGCGFTNAVEVARSTIRFNDSFPASCPLAVAWALFETHALQAAARRHLGQDVVGVEHFGTYACRNLYHRPSGRRSEHATANAIDVAAFTLADGSRVTVEGDWAGDTRKAAFLRAVRDGACRFFDVVLSPDYNEAHRDHFHFDMGSFRACR